MRLILGIPVVPTLPEIDISNADRLLMALLDVVRDGHKTFIVDMSETIFCDSSGFRSLLLAHQRAQAEGGELRLVACSRAVRRVLAVNGLDQVFAIFGSLVEAAALPPPTTAGPAPERPAGPPSDRSGPKSSEST
jgi:anti-sigma B factor antagonist